MNIVKPSSTKELKEIIKAAIDQHGHKVNLNFIDTSDITNMACLFEESKFNGNISDWNVSNVTDMNGMFMNSQFCGDISRWTTSNVTTTTYMFEGTSFNTDISKWDVSNVVSIRGMFYKSKFNNDISKWNVSSVVEMCHTFNTSVFNQDISKWNVSKVTNMRSMFENSVFDQDISGWDTSSVTNMRSMFRNSKFNQELISPWGKWNVSNVTTMQSMFDRSIFNQDISDWNTSSVTDMSCMFERSKFDQFISRWSVGSVTNMSGMFVISVFNQDISDWDTSSVTNMSWMFGGSKFNKDIYDWCVENVTDMSCMFRSSRFNKDISDWVTSSVITMEDMFLNSKFKRDTSDWDVTNVTDKPTNKNTKFSIDINDLDLLTTEDFRKSNANTIPDTLLSDCDNSTDDTKSNAPTHTKLTDVEHIRKLLVAGSCWRSTNMTSQRILVRVVEPISENVFRLSSERDGRYNAIIDLSTPMLRFECIENGFNIFLSYSTDTVSFGQVYTQVHPSEFTMVSTESMDTEVFGTISLRDGTVFEIKGKTAVRFNKNKPGVSEELFLSDFNLGIILQTITNYPVTSRYSDEGDTTNFCIRYCGYEYKTNNVEGINTLVNVLREHNKGYLSNIVHRGALG